MNTFYIVLGLHEVDMKRFVEQQLEDIRKFQAPEHRDAVPNVHFFPEEGMHPHWHGAVASRFVSDTWFANGGSIICATHSEVILLRLRRLVAEGKLKPEQLVITWLGDGTADPMSITVDSEGEVSDWPEGVFSEAFEELNGIRRAQRPTSERAPAKKGS